ncbi:cartilage intermediate layer protein 1 [Erpetoichthys calabaricus]|uniref:cartilage intermediate layer protein 1 n=1 Tax=Erpetoichthys calabaricus TaxID=27687 RepID=UPI00223444FC|nr:cartilage intermediate layer protein 1 [Erpetoichthys calabaricus]
MRPLVCLFYVLISALAQDAVWNESSFLKWGRSDQSRMVNYRGLQESGNSEWTSWFNIDHPGGNGDYELLEAIRFYYPARLCARPLAIEARTTDWVLAEETGEVVHFTPEKGFWCINKEQAGGISCSNYHVRFQCPSAVQSYWTSWSSWSSCSASACSDAGIQSRRRKCLSTKPHATLQTPVCEGQPIQRRDCATLPCPDSKWSSWSSWTPCTVTCGGGHQSRKRTCINVSSNQHCFGRPAETKKCNRSPCPACQRICSEGRVNNDCSECVCHGHFLSGKVRSLQGAPITGARIFLRERPRVIRARTDEKGSFRIQGVCASNQTFITIKKEKFAPVTLPTFTNATGTSWVMATLQRAEQPYIVKHPESKIRFEGERVAFCCKANGAPIPEKYYWYHNGTLLDRRVYKYDDILILRDLKPWQAGQYHCKASNEMGVIKSIPALLLVVAKDKPACNPKPEEHLIKLPVDCVQPGSNSMYYNVGQCPQTRCAGSLDFDLRCKDKEVFCCSAAQMITREINCGSYKLPIRVVSKCGCQTCIQPKLVVQGRVVAADTGEPLRFGHIYIGKERVGTTGYKGTFTIQVPQDTERLVVKFMDMSMKFVDTIKVFPFDRKGGSVFHDVKVLRRKEPIDVDSSKSSTIYLGEIPGEDPIGQIVIPPNSFYKPNGEEYQGIVKTSITFLDPRNISTASAAPGELNFVNDDGELFPLRTYGMFSVDFRDGTTSEQLQAGNLQIYLDSEHVQIPEHIPKMKLWSLNPETGIWEEEGDLKFADNKNRTKREERSFLIGNMEVRERRLFNLDVPEGRRCYVKVRAYMSDKFLPTEQLEGVVISLINLEPMPGYSSNPRAWGRFDSVITGSNGACLPAFCDAVRPDAYTAYVTATMGGEELEAAASSPKLNPNIIGVSQPYLGKLGYQRTDHKDSALKKTAFKVNLAKPNPNNIDEANGPLYAYQNLNECETAPVSANHFRFYRVEGDKYEYNVVPYQESDLTSWTGDYLSWWPNPQEFRACYMKVKINGPTEVMIRSRNLGGTHPQTKGKLYGIRDMRSTRDMRLTNSSAACLEFKCAGMLFDQNLVDRSLIEVIPQGNCRRVGINSLLQEYLTKHPPLRQNNDSHSFNMLAPVDPLGHNYGIYTVTDQNPRLAKEIAIGRCFDGTSDGFSREMKSDLGIGLTFSCPERPVSRQSLFQRLQLSPGATITQIGQDMRSEFGREVVRGPSQVVAYPAGQRSRTVVTQRRNNQSSTSRRTTQTRAQSRQ